MPVGVEPRVLVDRLACTKVASEGGGLPNPEQEGPNRNSQLPAQLPGYLFEPEMVLSYSKPPYQRWRNYGSQKLG